MLSSIADSASIISAICSIISVALLSYIVIAVRGDHNKGVGVSMKSRDISNTSLAINADQTDRAEL